MPHRLVEAYHMHEKAAGHLADYMNEHHPDVSHKLETTSGENESMGAKPIKQPEINKIVPKGMKGMF